jgi:phage gp29-like protein
MVTATKPSGLVDHLGRPLTSTANLKVEVSGATLTGVRNVLSAHPEIGLDPVRLATILKSAEQGDAKAYLELAEAMEEKDPHYLSVLGTRKRAVAQLPITVEAAGEDPESERDAELIRTWLKRDTLEDELFDLLDAVGKGYSVSELVWETSTRQWMPRRIKYRLPQWFQYDRTDGETLRLRDDTADGAELEPFKYVVHEHKAKSGLAIRGGLARVVAWSYLFKNFSIKDWVAFAEVYGLPFRLGRYDTGATEADRRALLNALAQIGSDAAGIIPKSTDIEFVDGKMAASDGALFEKLATYLDQQVSKAVLGQTATTDAVASGLGGGLGKVHDGVRGDIERADAKQLAATLNLQLVQPMVMLNHGPRVAYPRIVLGREEAVDLKAMVEAAGPLIDRGLQVSESWARKLIRAPEPKAGEAVLKPITPASAQTPQEPAEGAPPLPSPATPPKKPRTALLEPLKPQTDRKVALHSAGQPNDADAIDLFIGSQLEAWEELVEPVIGPVEAMLADAADLAEAKDRLLGLIESDQADELVQLLARGGFSARLAGASGQSLDDRVSE